MSQPPKSTMRAPAARWEALRTVCWVMAKSRKESGMPIIAGDAVAIPWPGSQRPAGLSGRVWHRELLPRDDAASRPGSDAMSQSQFSLLRRRRFLPFFLTQALGAFNDNVFRNAL